MSVVEFPQADPTDVLQFLELVKDGAGHIHAGYSVGWSRRQIFDLLKDPVFAEMVDEAEEHELESIEMTAHRLAKAGNTRMIELVLFCKARHRGWRPPTQRIESVNEGKPDRDVVAATVASVRELLANGELQELPPVIEAELVEEG